MISLGQGRAKDQALPTQVSYPLGNRLIPESVPVSTDESTFHTTGAMTPSGACLSVHTQGHLLTRYNPPGHIHRAHSSGTSGEGPWLHPRPAPAETPPSRLACLSAGEDGGAHGVWGVQLTQRPGTLATPTCTCLAVQGTGRFCHCHVQPQTHPSRAGRRVCFQI